MQAASSVIEYSSKQMAYIKEALHEDPRQDHRWNVKSGATQCGKTTVDLMMVIPYRIIVRLALKGLVAICGVTLGTIERNVLEPMREYFLEKGQPNVISDRIHNDPAGNKYVLIFGQKVFLLGMLNKTAVSRLRGAKFKYVYCDELAEYNQDAFDLMKSRLSLEYSCCDSACNPASETHWLYAFLHRTDIDLYLQEWTIFDNPFLPKKYVDSLCAEYAGSVLYDRYILGKWKRAEGLIYTKFADNKQAYILHETPKIMKINIGVDWGGNGSATTFVATGIGFNYGFVVHLESRRFEGVYEPAELEKEFTNFINMLKDKYADVLLRTRRGFDCYCDSAEQTLIAGFRSCVAKNKLPVQIWNAKKMPIKDRIMLQIRLLGQNRLFFMFNASTCINAYATAVWNMKEGHEDERLDDGTSDIDTMDACEYSFEQEKNNLIRTNKGGLELNG